MKSPETDLETIWNNIPPLPVGCVCLAENWLLRKGVWERLALQNSQPFWDREVILFQLFTVQIM